MMKIIKSIFTMIISISLGACSTFTPPRENPLLTKQFEGKYEQSDESFAVVATDANRRVAILDIFTGQICVEPPPEAANSISEAFAVLFESDVIDKGSLGASLSQSISQNISQLYRRTQTVQLYRDAVFSLCQSAINGSIEIAYSTKAGAPPDVKLTLVEALSSLEEDPIFSEQVFELKEHGLYSKKTIEALAQKINTSNSDEERGRLLELQKILNAGLLRAEFRRRLGDSLMEAFEALKEEIPLFYDTEKLRFLAEIGKPIQVCNTEYSPKSANSQEMVRTVTCRAEIPEGIGKVLNEYVKAIQAAQN